MSENLRNVNNGKVKALEDFASTIESQSETRRRFIKKAIATAPVILTVTAGPVWARNCTHSGRLSGNLSGKKGTGLPCCGWTPGMYKDLERWAKTPILPTDLWADTFGCTFDEVEGLTNHAVITAASSGGRVPAIIKFAAHAVASLNNSWLAGPCECDFGLTPDQVIGKVQGACINGNYEEVKDFLEFMNEADADTFECY